MEIKKSYRADLENKRPTWFLSGLVFVLALLFSALEFTTSDQGYGNTQDALDDAAQDIELIPAIDRKDMVAAEPSQSKPLTSGKINPVDKVTAELEKKVQLIDMRTTGEGEGNTNTSSSINAADDAQTTALSPVPVDEDNNPLKFQVLEQYPEFPGGMVELMKWLNANLHYPESAQTQKIQGKVVVAFIINKDGSISNPHVTTSVHPLLDREALRVVRMMPKWKPGMERKTPCRTMFVIPINFKL